MHSARVTPAARADLVGIWEYIARDDLDAADRVVSEVEGAIARIAKMRRLGRRRRPHPTRSRGGGLPAK